ncbi:MAG: glycolate oxidase subunit GlcE [Alphaproteobacteria bacterium]|nr:glycolate oxidase subunit GlcE [Alphaproteobacteria bacterium]
MTTVLRPHDAREVLDAVSWAAAGDHPLDVLGTGTKRGIGRPVNAEHALDLSGLAGITLYEPEELVMTMLAATPMAEIEAAVAGSNQMLAFEPPDLGPLLGSGGAGTIGGTLACNLAGPRRLKSGAARDHFLGVAAVSGRGEQFKSGGRVVKNVTGYDLCKLLAGSYGTLAVMTEVTIKVLPRPEKTRTVLVMGLGGATAARAMAAALNSPHEVSGAAHLPQAVAARSAVSYVAGAGRAVTALRIEGPGPSVAYRCERLREELGSFGAVEELHSHNSTTLWRELRDVARLIDGADRAIWRVSVPPMAGAAVTEELARALDVVGFADWGGGLLWLGIAGASDAGASRIRSALAPVGGHATLIRAEAALRAAMPVFQPQPAPLAELTRRVKENFDPKRILNPGRMVAGV